MKTPSEPSDLVERVQVASALLEQILDEPALLVDVDVELRKRLMIAAGRFSTPDKNSKRAFTRAKQRKERRAKKEVEEALLDLTGIRELRRNPIFLTPRRQQAHGAPPPPSPGTVSESKTCYTCQSPYKVLHHFYDQLCTDCGDLNYAKRFQVADLTGRVALVTGGRVKIGYQAGILLLRSGAHLIVTTRFPKDSAARFAAEADFEEWADRLEIHGLDLRHTPSVEQFCAAVRARHSRLDVIINNACQTVRRPPAFYEHLMAVEGTAVHALPDTHQRVLAPEAEHQAALVAPGNPGAAALSQVPLLPEDHDRGSHLFPQATFDADLQQVDLREVNSWRLKMEDVPTIELLEVHLVNAVAPFVINARLKSLMAAVPTNDAHIINVSAMEGQFYRTFKSARHPHTNMAKASLNMMTRTAALDYIEYGIHMNAVDTGWVTDEDPAAHAERKRQEHRFHPPLDIVDGAARIVDPFLHGLNTGEHTWGQFLKDYKVCDW